MMILDSVLLFWATLYGVLLTVTDFKIWPYRWNFNRIYW